MLTTQGQYNNGDDDGDHDDYDDEHGDDGGPNDDEDGNDDDNFQATWPPTRTQDDADEDNLADDADRGWWRWPLTKSLW